MNRSSMKMRKEYIGIAKDMEQYDTIAMRLKILKGEQGWIEASVASGWYEVRNLIDSNEKLVGHKESTTFTDKLYQNLEELFARETSLGFIHMLGHLLRDTMNAKLAILSIKYSSDTLLESVDMDTRLDLANASIWCSSSGKGDWEPLAIKKVGGKISAVRICADDNIHGSKCEIIAEPVFKEERYVGAKITTRFPRYLMKDIDGRDTFYSSYSHVVPVTEDFMGDFLGKTVLEKQLPILVAHVASGTLIQEYSDCLLYGETEEYDVIVAEPVLGASQILYATKDKDTNHLRVYIEKSAYVSDPLQLVIEYANPDCDNHDVREGEFEEIRRYDLTIAYTPIEGDECTRHNRYALDRTEEY